CVLLLALSSFCLALLFFFIVPAPTVFYTLSLHDALPILLVRLSVGFFFACLPGRASRPDLSCAGARPSATQSGTRRALSMLSKRSEEHTSELQSRENLVCRLLLEKKKQYRDVKLSRIHP